MAWQSLLSLMPATQPRIVFIDNSIHTICKSIDELKTLYNKVLTFKDETEGVKNITSSPPDLIFINLDLLPNDGVTLTKELRIKNLESRPFIIIYSHKQEDFVQELVFNSGADAFINFHEKPAVLKLFTSNLIKRRYKIGETIKSGVAIDHERYLIFFNGRPVQLPRKEFRVLELLFSNPDKFHSKAEIAANIWHDEKVADKRIIDVHIYNIRQAFGKRLILSKKGKGYRLNKKV